MKVMSEEKAKLLAEKNRWSLARAEGYVDGENCRRLGTMPSMYVQIGIDEYSSGFRTGYYERQDFDSPASLPGRLVARQ